MQTRVGYAGASTLDPSYRNINGHAEVVRVITIKTKSATGNFLEVLNHGLFMVESRASIARYFCFDLEQKQVAEELIQAIGKEKSPEVIEAGEQNGYFGPPKITIKSIVFAETNSFVGKVLQK